jgi:hypothetical protein
MWWIESAEWEVGGLVYELEESDPGQIPPSVKKLYKGLSEFKTYIERNGGNILNYGERRRYGELISTSFAESMVNAVVAKSVNKRQQMHLTPRGARPLLQTRIKVLNGELARVFEFRYPGFREKPTEQVRVAA